MTKAGNTLTEDEVRQISSIIETLNHSTFDHLQLEIGELKLSISKAGSAAPAQAPPQIAPVAQAPAAQPVVRQAAPAPAPAASQAAPADGTVGITAPLIGRFYSQPEPGASPFVTVGSEVDEDTTVGLVEAMKMFNAVRADVAGVITEICVQDAALVEFGQVLFRIRPAGGRA